MVSKDELDVIYAKFLTLADGKKDVSDDDILGILGKEVSTKKLEIVSLDVNCSHQRKSHAKIAINRNEVILEAEADGNGPLDATKKAIDKIMKNPVRLEEYLVQAVTGGSDDLGKVHIQISKDGVFNYGFGSDTDVIFASAQAYLEAVNKA